MFDQQVRIDTAFFNLLKAGIPSFACVIIIPENNNLNRDLSGRFDKQYH
jgi:hypothetical protein